MIALVVLAGLMLSACDKRSTPAPVRGAMPPVTESIATEHAPIQEEIIDQITPSQATTEESVPEPVLAPTPKSGGNFIALLLPMSGTQKEMGRLLQQAAEMAIFEKGDASLTLRVYDTKGSVAGAEKAAQQAIQEQASLIVGPVFADEVRAVGQVARSHQVQVLSFSNNRSVAGNGVFVLGFTPEEQIQAVALYLNRQAGNRLAAVSPHNEYGQLFDRELKRLSTQQAMQLTEIVHYNPNGSNLNRDLEALRTLSYDALFIPEGGAALDRILEHLQRKGLLTAETKLVGTGQWDEVHTLQNPILNQAILAGPDPKKRRTFEEKYQTTYGVAPSRLASLAYDAVCLVAALKKHFPDAPYDLTALTQPSGFDGVNGTFRLLQDGSIQRKLAILEVSQGRLVVREPAGKSF